MTWIFCKKNWSKTHIAAWNRSSNILLPPICSHHRLLCSMTKLKEHSREICYPPPQVTTEAALGLIGGTMGLLTGFSILSGVEIVYYLLRFQLFLSFLSTSSQESLKSLPGQGQWNQSLSSHFSKIKGTHSTRQLRTTLDHFGHNIRTA